MAEIIHMSKPPGAGAVCETDTKQRVFQALQVCHRLGWMGAIVGPAGIGKTYSLEAYAAAEPAWMCTINHERASAFAALSAIADVVSAYHVERGSSPRFDAIVHTVSSAKHRHVLILDEAHQLTLPAVNAIRSIHDATGLPIVFAGNTDVINRMYTKKGVAIPSLEQIESRFGLFLRLESSSVRDLGLILSAHGVDDPKVREFIRREIRGHLGNLRTVERWITSVRLCAGEESIQLRHIKDAQVFREN